MLGIITADGVKAGGQGVCSAAAETGPDRPR
jgi:hypothetical protein